ncbi:MAG: tetratricopeptide repeat protein [Phenylobacterium sp.]|nr:MAG: tetratricopeptide repeat protein [Phenylobacterium sp.]
MAGRLFDEADALLAQGRAAEALALTAPLAAAADADLGVLSVHAAVLKALKRPEEALAFDERATAAFPASAIAWHNRAATLGDLGRGADALAAIQEAMRLGLDGAPTWTVYARALTATGDFELAETAYRESLLRAPADGLIACELADLVWMRRGDAGRAQAVLDTAFHGGAAPSPLLLHRAKLLEAAGDPTQAARLLAMAVERLPDDLPLILAAAQAAVETGQVAAAEGFLAMAQARAPERADVVNQAVIVELAAGRPDAALATARGGLARDPDNTSLWAWAASAARAAGDPLYEALCDYRQMVGVYEIETPPGWASLPAYLADLAAALRRLHPFAEAPIRQSLRQGSQTLQPLLTSTAPEIRAFFKAIEAPIRAHMARLGEGSDPLRRRNTGRYSLDGAWSVSLRPGGFHEDHFHPLGWLSSAFYVETPTAALDTPERQGWIRFGQPPLALSPPLPPAHYVRPQPGRLVLFPSYLWHGTEPFTTNEPRLTMAFDVVPA